MRATHDFLFDYFDADIVTNSTERQIDEVPREWKKKIICTQAGNEEDDFIHLVTKVYFDVALDN